MDFGVGEGGADRRARAHQPLIYLDNRKTAGIITPLGYNSGRFKMAPITILRRAPNLTGDYSRINLDAVAAATGRPSSAAAAFYLVFG